MTYYKRTVSSDFPIHITARSNNRENFPCPTQVVWNVLSDYLHILPSGFGVKICSFVLMPNHFHLIVRDPSCNMSAAMAYFMRETSREIGRISNRINKIWGGPYFSSVIDSDLYYLRAYKYVYQNPLRAGLCTNVQDYHFSSLATLLGKIRGIIPLECDEMLMGDCESTLSWLNNEYSEDEIGDIKGALRRKNFKIRIRPETKKHSPLELWDDLPKHILNYQTQAPSKCVTKT